MKRLAYPYLIWMLGFIIIPILFVFGYGYQNIFSIFDEVHFIPLLLSLKLSIICTLICILISIPLGIILRQYSRLIIFLFMLPMWMNTVLSTLSWKLILAPNGLFHIQNVLNTELGTLIGMIYDLIPFAIIPICNSIKDIDIETINSAYDLGASKFQVIRYIILPNAKYGITSGIVMVFVPALTSFVISDMLGGGKVHLIGNVIEQEFTNSMNWNLGSGLSLTLMLFVLISTIIMRRSK